MNHMLYWAGVDLLDFLHAHKVSPFKASLLSAQFIRYPDSFLFIRTKIRSNLFEASLLVVLIHFSH